MHGQAGTAEKEKGKHDQEKERNADGEACGRFRRRAEGHAVVVVAPSGKPARVFVDPWAVPLVSLVAAARPEAEGVRISAIEAVLSAFVLPWE